MNQHSHAIRRALPAFSALSLALALAGCGANDPAPATQSMSRSAASVTMTVADEQYNNALQHLYVAYFGRPADPLGLQYWERQLKQIGAPSDPAGLSASYRSSAQVRAIVDAFANSLESQQLFPGATATFVDGVYRNLFNRGAELPGLAWWTNAIDSGVITRSEAALMIMLGAQNDDALGVRNKIAVAERFYGILTQRTSDVLNYTGNRNNEIARRMMAMVDARTDLAAFEVVIRATIEEMATNVVN
jgi:hypothetical protein